MACSCCTFGHTADQHFTREKVAKELERYRRKGLGRTARLLRHALAAARLTNGTVLDVGAGVGGLTLALLDQGMSRGIQIEASAAYLASRCCTLADREACSTSSIFVNLPTPSWSGNRNFCMPSERKTAPTMTRISTVAAGARLSKRRFNMLVSLSSGLRRQLGQVANREVKSLEALTDSILSF